jgi:hypothetical protein
MTDDPTDEDEDGGGGYRLVGEDERTPRVLDRGITAQTGLDLNVRFAE